MRTYICFMKTRLKSFTLCSVYFSSIGMIPFVIKSLKICGTLPHKIIFGCLLHTLLSVLHYRTDNASI